MAYTPTVHLDQSLAQVWFAILGFGIAEALLQGTLAAAFPSRPIGDESEYINRGAARHPFNPVPFFRVPVLPIVAWVGGRFGNAFGFLRLTSVLCSVVAMAATAGAAVRLGGVGIGVSLSLLLFMIPERIILGSRIWPDVYLAAATAPMILIMSLAPSAIGWDRAVIALGVLVALSVMIRLDGLVVFPAMVAAWVMVAPPLTSTPALWLIGLPILVLTSWWLIARLVFGQDWLDTTWLFNLGITIQEAEAYFDHETVVVDDLIRRYKADPGGAWGAGQAPTPRFRRIPWRSFGLSVISRLRVMIGPDTFVRGKVLPTVSGLEGHPISPVLNAALRWSVPILAAASLVATGWRLTAAIGSCLPALSLLIPAVLFHARTRYRLPAIYGAVPALAASLGLAAAPPTASVFSTVAVVALVVLVAICLARPPRRLERLGGPKE